MIYALKDRYDWDKLKGVTIPVTVEMIHKYLPKGVPVISPKGGVIQIDDEFFHEMKELGYGRDFDVKSESPPLMFEFTQPRPGAQPSVRALPAQSTPY